MKNHLSKTDIEHFYSIYMPLLFFVNIKYNYCPFLDCTKPIPFEIAIDLSRLLWSEPTIIDEFIKLSKLTFEDISILNAWKNNFVRDKFFMERTLADGAIFISEKHVYKVKSLYTDLKDMVDFLPSFVETVLLPFKGAIITDGLITISSMRVAPDFKKVLKEHYMEAKKENKIIVK